MTVVRERARLVCPQPPTAARLRLLKLAPIAPHTRVIGIDALTIGMLGKGGGGMLMVNRYNL